MSPNWFHILAALLLFLFQTTTSGAEISWEDLQIPSEEYVQSISTSDGSTIIGRITRIGSDSIEFTTDMGIVTIPIQHITAIRIFPATSMRNGELWLPDPNTTRLYFAPTGRMLPRGSGYVADYYLFFPSFNYGVTDRISLGGGFSIFPTGSMDDQIYFFTPKIRVKHASRFDIAAGALVMKIPNFDDEDSPLLSIVYGTGTWGSSDRSITCSAGYGMADTEIAEKPMIVLGGEQRLTRRLAFVTENWILPGVDDAMVSYGIRFLTEKFTTDFAFLNTTGGDALFPGIPYIDFVYNF